MDGELVPLAEQERSRHDRAKIDVGRFALKQALALRAAVGPYVLQAAIASLQAEAEIDWNEIMVLYERLERLTGSPVVALDRAVAVAEAGAPERALQLIDSLDLGEYRYFYSTRAELLAVSAATTKLARRSRPPRSKAVGACRGKVLITIEGVTIRGITVLGHRRVTAQIGVGLVPLGPLVVKIASTSWRFMNYCASDADYGRAGAPGPRLMGLAPVVAVSARSSSPPA